MSELYGEISIRTTDPARSNSGMLFAGLLANLLNGGQVVDDTSLPKVLPVVKRLFAKLGFMDDSSADLFRQYLEQGMGAYPIIVGYENQLVEYGLQNPADRDKIRSRVRVLYPRPTVWSNHVFIALTPDGVRLLDALKDPQMLQMAWQRHGFRSGANDDPKVLQLAGIPERIESVMPMPKPHVVDRIVAELAKQ